ncbi:hypothetical protein H4219_003038 [Mycoemilia scoparia]|uniref:S1 motif domain-containing protein n=1 Tax=Mycoemilia scoparia TaxID=417184 RepID=A0A9W8DTK3_9FUNG|nr:hypothetical protein H4219_003038 [Mycoemilia scoparia]
MTQNFRFYRNKFPKPDDVVMVKVTQISEIGAYVVLEEYNEISGMILSSELSRRRIRSIQKMVRVGRRDVALVLRVDEEKGYIDLSKKNVTEEDRTKCTEKFEKSRTVHSILRNVAANTDADLEQLYEGFVWDLYDKYGHAYDAFKIAVTEPDTVLKGFDIDPVVKAELLKHIGRRLTPQPVKIRSDIEITNYTYDGIEAIKTAIRAGLKFSTKEIDIKVRLISPPLFVVTTTCLEKQKGIDAVTQATQAIEEAIVNNGGIFVMKMKPKAVSETDDKELAEKMAQAEKENAEVSGDDESDMDADF